MIRPADRYLFAVVLILVDLVIFMLPLTGLLAGYLLIARPLWFRRWVEELYESL